MNITLEELIRFRNNNIKRIKDIETALHVLNTILYHNIENDIQVDIETKNVKIYLQREIEEQIVIKLCLDKEILMKQGSK